MNHPSTSSGHATLEHHQQQPQHHAIDIPAIQLPERNTPGLDLLERERRADYVRICVPLYEAAIKGDWKAAKHILDEDQNLIRSAITENEETLLHIAASAESTKNVKEFVKNLVALMETEDLALQNKSLDTALSSAAAAGNIETAKIMVEKNPELIHIPNQAKTMPLYMAALFAKADMVRYLYGLSNSMSGDYWTHENRGWVLQKCVEAEIFDVAIKIADNFPELTEKKGLLTEVLLALAKKAHAFEGTKPNVVSRIKSFFAVKVGGREKESEALQLLKKIWKKIATTMPKDEIDQILRGPPGKVVDENKEKECEALPILREISGKLGKGKVSETVKENKPNEKEKQNKPKTPYPSRVLFLAAKKGNTRFIVELIRLYPDLIWKQDDKEKSIFHLAIKRRQENIYNLLYEIGAMKDLITPKKDIKGNNMLHMVAKSAKQTRFQNVSGVALQMQRELLWFEEVKNMIPPEYREKKNGAGETPQELFTKKHAYLVTKGEEWMKNTASQCMVVATLIATIVFTAAFTLPGGYKQETGIPFFRKEPALIIFVISDAISLISSSTSVLIFLSILTSRYAEKDFLASLPNKLMAGLTTLFLSIVAMMVAFSASFFVLYNKKVKWVPITITSMAGVPVILFAILQFRLLGDVFYSTYGSRYLFKPKKRILYF